MEGKRYLLADLSLACYEEKHVMAIICSSAVLLFYALGLPVFLLLKLGGRQRDRNEHSNLGFLQRNPSLPSHTTHLHFVLLWEGWEEAVHLHYG